MAGRCTFQNLRRKEVINQRNGYRIGYVDDLEINTATADLCSLIIFGRAKFFGLFGRSEDFIIPWQNIRLIGEDTILVDFSGSNCRKREKHGFFCKKG
ncbi:MAG: YlmC/YmxH family sporulation protein [bacterium]|nr:YlmC/YmxH family sporulation protein [bacterium]MDD6225994.1 YlmC/YmxH family sporulation protein [bacterium]MDY3861055.1 YlmC/YmxH family sporulation protein [Ruminococcus sp.]